MINEASRNNLASLKASVGTIDSVIGRPLALVNIEWSLALARDTYTNQPFFPSYIPEE